VRDAAATVAPLIEARGVSVRYGPHTVLTPTDLTIGAGATTVIVGPNGAGKTTLMRALTGELAPSSGAVLFDGADIATLSAATLARRRAVLPQATRLSFPFTVHEVVRLGCPAGRDDSARIAALLERVDLAGFGHRYYQQLSGGEQQRVQLARVLAQLDIGRDGAGEGDLPRALFLDEPTSSLDIRHQIAVLEIARTYAAAGWAVLAILHDLNMAAMFADRILVVDRGRVVADGRPAAVITAELVSRVFGVNADIGARDGIPYVLPPRPAGLPDGRI